MFYIHEKYWRKLLDYCNAAYNEFKSEITGYMILSKDKEGDWEMKDPIILKQEVSSGSCEIDREASASYFVDAFNKYGENVRFVWWHTHGNMGAFWSSTDTQNMEDQCNNGWAASLVINIRGEYKFRVNFHDPIKAHSDIDITIVEKKAKKISKKIVDEVKDKCSKPVYNYTRNLKKNSHVTYKSFNNQLMIPGTNRDVTSGEVYRNLSMRNNWYELYADFRDKLDEYVDGNLSWIDLKSWIDQENKKNAAKGNDYYITEFDEADLQTAMLDDDYGYAAMYGVADYDQFIVCRTDEREKVKDELPY